MKFCNALIFCFSMLLSISYSQIISDYGVKSGLVFSNLNIENESDGVTFFIDYNDQRMGPTIGLYLNYFNKRYIFFETDLLYIQKGGNAKLKIPTVQEPDGTGEYIIYDAQFDYLQLQNIISPKYNIKHFEISALMGITLNYLLESKGLSILQSDFSDFNFGYLLGLGISVLDVLNKRISLEFYYNTDFSNIYKNDDLKYTNEAFVLRVGLSLNSN